INNPPTSGSYTTDSSAVEAIISQNTPTFFMQVLGFNLLPVRARAVAKAGYSTACIFALDKTASGALSLGGGSTLNLGCGGVSESNNPKSISVTGSTTLNLTNGASLGAVGSYSVDNNAAVSPSYGIDGGIISPGDPLANLAMPTYSSQPCF